MAKKYFRALGLLCLLSVSAWAKSNPQKVYEKLETLARVISYVESNYIEDVDVAALLDHAISGFVGTLDPHTTYLPPNLNKEFREDTSGKYEGVGIELSMKEKTIVVVSPIDGSPAAAAGVASGDHVLEIDGVSTEGMDLVTAIQSIRGSEGSKVKFKFLREGVAQPFIIELKRAKIALSSVSSQIFDQEFAYIKIKSFQEHTDRDFKKQMQGLQSKVKKQDKETKELKGLILDLRNNPGGLLEPAVRIADFFLDSGVIVSVRGRRGEFAETKYAQKDTWEVSLPTVVLVNEGTASASEILAGALKDHGVAVITGKTTFGKGSVQTLLPLGEASLKVTVARYYGPKGQAIQAVGIVPDIQISASLTPEEAALREKDLLGHIATYAGTELGSIEKQVKKPASYDADVQLSRSLEYLKAWTVFGHKFVGKTSG